MVSTRFHLVIVCEPFLSEPPPFTRAKGGGLSSPDTRRLARMVRQSWEGALRPRIPVAPYAIEFTAHVRKQAATTGPEEQTIEPLAANAFALAASVLEEVGALPQDQIPLLTQEVKPNEHSSRLEVRVISRLAD